MQSNQQKNLHKNKVVESLKALAIHNSGCLIRSRIIYSELILIGCPTVNLIHLFISLLNQPNVIQISDSNCKGILQMIFTNNSEQSKITSSITSGQTAMVLS